MKRHALKSSLFRKYLLLYFLAVFLPAAIVSVVAGLSYRALKEEVIQSNQMSVRLIQKSLDVKLMEAQDLVTRLQEDPQVTQYALEHAPIQAIQSLRRHVQSQDLLQDVLLNVRGSRRLYSSQGAFSVEELQYHYPLEDLSSEEWYRILNEVKEPTFCSIAGKRETYLFLFSPVYATFQYNNDSPRIAAMIIRDGDIREFFRSSQTSNIENILLLDSGMNLLSAIDPPAAGTDTLDQIRAYLEAHPALSGYGSLELDGEANMLFVYHSRETGLYYVRLLPERLAFQDIRQIQLITLLVMAFVVLVGAGLIWMGMSRGYKPIRDLAVSVRARLPENYEGENELLLLRQAFDDILETNQFLSSNAGNSRRAIKDHFLTSLIKGSFVSEDLFRNTCKNLGIAFSGSQFLVCSLLIEKSGEQPDFEKLLETIRRQLPEGFQVQIKDLLFAGRLLLVMCSDCTDFAAYRQVLQDLKEGLFREEGLLVSIGMGNFYGSYDQIGKSYLESVNALDYRMIYGKDCVITPDMLHTSPTDFSYPYQEFETLQAALQSRKPDAVEEAVQQISSFIKSSGCSLHTAKYICYDALAVLKKTLFLLDAAYVRQLSHSLDITQLVSFNTIDEFFVTLADICRKALHQEAGEEDIVGPNVEQQMVAYIHENCFSYHFQVNSMAEHFAISPQYMRKLFKNHTGLSISSYVMDLKLERAMQLLRESNLNLNEIVEAIGNVDVSGFIRLFKQRTGMTPGQYRKKYRHSGVS